MTREAPPSLRGKSAERWEQMRSAAKMLRGVASAATAAPPIYVAQYSGADASRLPSVEISKYPGLLFCHEVRSANGTIRLVACWSTKDHFTRDSASFAGELGAVLADDHGFVASPKFQNEPLWKRIRPTTALITAAAVIGAIQVIVQTYHWLFVTPSLELKAIKLEYSAVENQQFTQTLEILNHLPATHRDIALTGTLRDASGKEHSVKLQPASVPHLSAKESQAVAVVATAPRAGKYQLSIDVRASAGHFMPAATFPFVRDVIVWPELPVGRVGVGYVRDDMVFVLGRLDIGPSALHGLECELEIPRVSGLHFEDAFDFLSLERKAEWHTVETPGEEDAILSWSTDSIEGERSVEFSLALQRQAATDWHAVLKQAEVRCQYRRRKDNVA